MGETQEYGNADFACNSISKMRLACQCNKCGKTANLKYAEMSTSIKDFVCKECLRRINTQQFGRYQTQRLKSNRPYKPKSKGRFLFTVNLKSRLCKPYRKPNCKPNLSIDNIPLILYYYTDTFHGNYVKSLKNKKTQRNLLTRAKICAILCVSRASWHNNFVNNRCSYLPYDNDYFFAVVQIAVTSAVNRVVVGSSPTVLVWECNSVGRVRKISAFAYSPQNFEI